MKPLLRIGTGFDIHRLRKGVPLILGMVQIPSEHGLVSVTDGDVVTHALIDALLAAAGAPDIGSCFPPTDDRWRGRPSGQMLSATRSQYLAPGFKLIQADITILAEQPALAPHSKAIRETLARALGIQPAQISIKARSFEGLGPIGEGLAIAALVTVLAELPETTAGTKQADQLFLQSLALTGEPPPDAYLIFADGGSRGNPGPGACACIIYDPKHKEIGTAVRFLGHTTNNQAEYHGVLLALSELERLALHRQPLVIHLDSSLVFHQIVGKFRVKNPFLRKLLSEFQDHSAHFKNLRFRLVARARNQVADRLLNEELERRSH